MRYLMAHMQGLVRCSGARIQVPGNPSDQGQDYGRLVNI